MLKAESHQFIHTPGLALFLLYNLVMDHWQVLTLCLRPLPHQHPVLRQSVKYPSLNSLSNWGWHEMSCCCSWAVCAVHPAMCVHAKTKDPSSLFHYHFPPYSTETRSLTEGDANISSELLGPTCPYRPSPNSQRWSHKPYSASTWVLGIQTQHFMPTQTSTLLCMEVSPLPLTLNFGSSGLHLQVLVL